MLILSLSQSVASANSAADEGQTVWENKDINELRQLRLQEFARINEQKQLRLQECGGVCDDACEPKQNRLQKNEQLNAQKTMNRQQRHATKSKNERDVRNKQAVQPFPQRGCLEIIMGITPLYMNRLTCGG